MEAKEGQNMAQAPRQQSGLLRRILFGFTLQLLISAAVPPHLQPCFPAANTCFAALVVGRLKKPAWGVALLAAAVLLPLDAVRIGQHDIVDVVLSLVLGWM